MSKLQKRNNGGAKEGGKKTVVLKVPMHCDGCADKAIKSVKGVTGVEVEKADVENNELRLVVGKDVDLSKLRDRVAAKLQKKVEVELVSPPTNKWSDGGKEEENNRAYYPVSYNCGPMMPQNNWTYLYADPYVYHHPSAPPMFIDEDPNACPCSIM